MATAPRNEAAAGPLASASAALARVLGREPDRDETAMVARILDEYRATAGAAADREFVAISIATIGLTRGIADEAAKRIEAATRQQTWRWRYRTWAAAALSVAAMALIGYALTTLAGADLMTWAWWREWAVTTALLPLAGALLGAAAMMALPEVWARAKK